MKVFISWSGNKSHKVALVFREWLPSVIQSIEPYVSSEDIDKGARWSTDIAKELENSTFGLLCVTKENLNAPWLSFEAGALSKTMDKSLVSPFLFDIKRSEVNGPILQFQSTIFEKEDIKKLLNSMNKACGEGCISNTMLEKAFDVWYPTLECDLLALKDISDDSEENANAPAPKIHTAEILEEILELSRNNQKLLRNPEPKTIESIEEIKKLVAEQHVRNEKNNELRRMSRNLHPMFIEEILHVPPRAGKNYWGLLMVLGLLRNDLPWIYDLGKELIDILKSTSNKEDKQEAIETFRMMMETSLEHPMMREFYGTRKDLMFVKEFPYIVNRYLEDVSITE
ncbi:TIR domain-containing protein [Pararcticibacter amylolyticus]|uniref:TIR domain-containing protein n=1 Tax=Pararcticibacter amylolyticus TaxID=2173175 RepID=A0A2U2PIG1_9SPHI|nr:TIR domain-containing protein [Pararcticibacter amylolyticus]PWG81185.1 hypothetical protein DDR33_07295 [Pararcticibacter amylolyticus]